MLSTGGISKHQSKLNQQQSRDYTERFHPQWILHPAPVKSVVASRIVKPKLFLCVDRLGHQKNNHTIITYWTERHGCTNINIFSLKRDFFNSLYWLKTCHSNTKTTRWLTSVFSCGWKLWKLPSSSTRHGGTGGAGLHWSTTRMCPTWESVVDSGVRHRLGGDLMVDAGPCCNHITVWEKHKDFFLKGKFDKPKAKLNIKSKEIYDQGRVIYDWVYFYWISWII